MASPIRGHVLLVVEGGDDQRRVERLLPRDLQPSAVLIAGGGDGVVRTCRTLATGFESAFLGIRDRDLMTEAEIEELHRSCPSVFVWPQRCLENELLYPPLVHRALDLAGVPDITEERIRAELRQIADEQREAIHAHLVERVLMDEIRIEMPRRAEQPDTPYGRMLERFAAQADALQQRRSSAAAVATRVSQELIEIWEERHLDLLDGKQALGLLVQRLQTDFRGRTGLENALIRHAI